MSWSVQKSTRKGGGSAKHHRFVKFFKITLHFASRPGWGLAMGKDEVLKLFGRSFMTPIYYIPDEALINKFTEQIF